MELRPNNYDDEDFVGFFEVVALTGVSESTVSKWIRTRKLIPKKFVRSHKRYRVGDIKEIVWPEPPKSQKGRKGSPGAPRLELGGEPIRLYKEELWSIRDLATQFEVSYGGMNSYLRRNGVEIRPRGSSSRRKRQGS